MAAEYAEKLESVVSILGKTLVALKNSKYGTLSIKSESMTREEGDMHYANNSVDSTKMCFCSEKNVIGFALDTGDVFNVTIEKSKTTL